jgi:uncharacterized membrane protein
MPRMVLVLSLAASVGLSANAHAEGWHICNHTPEELNVAIAFATPQEQWVSQGWHTLGACGGCAFVMDHTRTEHKNVFYRAENSNGVERIGGRDRFCVSPQKFNFLRTPNCNSAGFRLQIIDTEGKFTTNIQGGVGGKTCID